MVAVFSVRGRWCSRADAKETLRPSRACPRLAAERQMIAGGRRNACTGRVGPPEESPNTTRRHAAYNTRESAAKAGGDGKCHRKQTAPGNGVRVKRRGKSSPPGVQTAGHEKPHEVQDRTGGGLPARPGPATEPGGLRVIVAPRACRGGPWPVYVRRGQINDHHGRFPCKGSQPTEFGLPSFPGGRTPPRAGCPPDFVCPGRPDDQCPNNVPDAEPP